MKARIDRLEQKLNRLVARLGLPHQVIYDPNPESQHRGEIKNNQILIHDPVEEEALETLIHEVVELRLKKVLALYRGLVNVLIDYVEKNVYHEKEHAIEQIVKDIRSILMDKI